MTKVDDNKDIIEIEEEIDLSNLKNGQITLEKKKTKICQEDKAVIEDL